MGDLIPFPKPLAKDPIIAEGLALSVDEGGYIWVKLFDKNGAVFSQACIPPQAADQLLDQARACARISAKALDHTPTVKH